MNYAPASTRFQHGLYEFHLPVRGLDRSVDFYIEKSGMQSSQTTRIVAQPEVVMRVVIISIVIGVSSPQAIAQERPEERNKALTRRFYDQVWFSRNLHVVDELVAPRYVVHDIGDRKGVTERAEEQKNIADFFWRNGTMAGRIDFSDCGRRSCGHTMAVGFPSSDLVDEARDVQREESQGLDEIGRLIGRSDTQVFGTDVRDDRAIERLSDP